ncbi:MAG: hypothetical protein ACOC44_14035 [Promethearchaeia archaeon]
MSSQELEISRELWEILREFRKYPSKLEYLKLVKLEGEKPNLAKDSCSKFLI